MNDKSMVKRDIVIIGGGPAGLAAALAAKKEGAESILILERDKELGGILNQYSSSITCLKKMGKVI